jgi:hypothetical protein
MNIPEYTKFMKNSSDHFRIGFSSQKLQYRKKMMMAKGLKPKSEICYNPHMDKIS